uniref:Uncharacterized protein n=1 Tax=Thermosporothrix sp. COM3 TaxID=2490863 RepID=A0A455SW27_9CHLR|nr:hypothetical protein KTC_64790 [Thermosporothrix sp. COM3]
MNKMGDKAEMKEGIEKEIQCFGEQITRVASARSHTIHRIGLNQMPFLPEHFHVRDSFRYVRTYQRNPQLLYDSPTL